MLTEHDLDAVLLSTWPSQHHEQVLQALETGIRSILCEKALATRERQAYEIWSAARATELASTAKSTNPWHLLRDIVPTNPFESLAKGDMLQVVFLALMVGIALTVLPRDRTRPFLDLSEILTEVFTMIVRWIVRCAPVGVPFEGSRRGTRDAIPRVRPDPRA